VGRGLVRFESECVANEWTFKELWGMAHENDRTTKQTGIESR
jgi:hypothetical protein